MSDMRKAARRREQGLARQQQDQENLEPQPAEGPGHHQRRHKDHSGLYSLYSLGPRRKGGLTSQSRNRATPSISTKAPFGKAAAPTTARAGQGCDKNSA